MLALIALGGAYALALCLAIACAVVPALLFLAFGRLDPSYEGAAGFLTVIIWSALASLTVGGFGAAFLMLWSLTPRRNILKLPGMRLSPEENPRLFAEIHTIAARFNIEPPGEVYLSGDMNVAVAAPLFSRRRLLVIGLPALQVLSTAELRALIAVGFAHLYTGDSVLNPWINHAATAVGRVMERLNAPPKSQLSAFVSAYGRLLRLPALVLLTGYWKFALRVVYSAVFRLERRADELACYIAGTRSLVAGLRSVYRYVLATAPFWQIEIGPVVSLGFLPPLAEGFGRFIATPRIDRGSAEFLYTEMNRTEITPSNPRPLLRDRIAAAPMHTVENPDDPECAIRLIDPESLERRLLAYMAPSIKVDALRPVAWDRVATDVYIPMWKVFVSASPGPLSGLTPRSLPDRVRNLPAHAARMRDPAGMLLAPAQRLDRLRSLLRFALSLHLLDEGWQLSIHAGECLFTKSEAELNPAAILADLESGKLAPEAWSEQCQSLGLREVPLRPDVFRM